MIETSKLKAFKEEAIGQAARRDDRAIVFPPRLNAPAARILADELVRLGLAIRIKAGMALPPFADGMDSSLIATDAGFEFAASDGVEKEVAHDEPRGISLEGSARSVVTPQEVPRPLAQRLGMALDMMRREGGATKQELYTTMGWAPKTAGAAIGKIKDHGYQVTSEKIMGRGRVYHAK